MISDLLSTHLLEVAQNHGYNKIDDILEESDRYILVTPNNISLVIRKDNIHELLESK